MEPLECRELLAVTLADFNTIKANYAALNLTDFTDYQIAEVGGSTDFEYADGQCIMNFSEGSLRNAISWGGDKETLVVVRTTDTQNTMTIESGELTYYNSIGVTVVSFGTVPLTIDANHQSRVFNIGEHSTVALAGLTITNGRVSRTYDAYGGGIYNDGTLALINCTVSGNSVTATYSDYARGGGIYNGGTLTVTNSIISGNLATGDGGGIANFGKSYSSVLTLCNTIIAENS